MDPQTIDKPDNDQKKRVNNKWILVVVIIAFLLWIVYTASQTQVVDTGTQGMPANMPGMIHTPEPQATMTGMPDMDH